jgi:hypothetical protein
MANWLARAQAITALPDDVAARSWRVCYPEVAAMEVLFTPPATRAEVSTIYSRDKLEPMSEPPRRAATPSEAAELRELVDHVLAGAGEADRAEALTVALADPEAALVSFRALATNVNEVAA